MELRIKFWGLKMTSIGRGYWGCRVIVLEIFGGEKCGYVWWVVGDVA